MAKHRSGSARRRRRKFRALDDTIASLQATLRRGDDEFRAAQAALDGMVRLMGINPTMIAINAFELEALLKLVRGKIDSGRQRQSQHVS